MAELTYNPNTKRYDTRETKSKSDVDSAKATEKMSSTAGAGLKGDSGRTPMPKQSDYSSIAAYSAAMSRWRADDTAARRQALK